MKDGEVLEKSLKYRIKGKKRDLRINMIEVADTGIYTCAVENDPSHKNATAALYGMKYCLSMNSDQYCLSVTRDQCCLSVNSDQ